MQLRAPTGEQQGGTQVDAHRACVERHHVCFPMAVGLWALASGLMADALPLLTDVTAYARGLMAITALRYAAQERKKSAVNSIRAISAPLVPAFVPFVPGASPHRIA